MGTLLARNATILVTMDDQRRELPGAGLFARDGVIEQVGPSADLPSDADVVLELTGHLLLPGLVNCHHHLDQVLTRNLPAGQNTNLFPWLRAHYRLWGRRTPPASRTATIVGLAELALSGATTVFDHAYVFGNGCRVDDQIAAAAEVGTRFVVSRGSMSLGESRGGLPPDDCVEDEDAILADSQRVIERYHDSRAGSMCQIALGVGQDGVLVLHTVVRREPTAGLAQRHVAAGDHEPVPTSAAAIWSSTRQPLPNT